MSEAPHETYHVPSPTDHIALRTLIKYLSTVCGIPYKMMCRNSRYNESTVKNYTNDKATRTSTSAVMFRELLRQCSDIIRDTPIKFGRDEYIVHIMSHLFGDKWLESIGIKLDVQALDITIAKWLDLSGQELSEVEKRYTGLWRVLRPAFRQHDGSSEDGKLRGINLSLLNVNSRNIGDTRLCSFQWYYLGEGREYDEYSVIEGFVIPQLDQIEFFGRVSSRYKLLSLMSWSFAPYSELRNHAETAYGIAMLANTPAGPISTRLRGFFIKGSDEVFADELSVLREKELRGIGHRSIESVRPLLPLGQFDRTLRYLAEDKPIVSFRPGFYDG
jgi:hypothetical protein